MREPVFASVALCALLSACTTKSSVSSNSPECALYFYCSCLDGTDTGYVCNGSCAAACATHGGAEPAGVCAPGTTACSGGECANLMTDSDNCGACHTYCTENTTCVAGACVVMLPADGSFSCRADSDCASGEACVVDAEANCSSPFCARPCAGDGGTCASGSCGAAIDAGTSAALFACIQPNDCS